MFCNLTRWLISRAEDQGKKLPRFAERHAARCGACREYTRFAASLSSRLSGETPAFLAKAPDVRLGPDIAVAPASPAHERVDKGWRGLRRPRLILRPLPVAAAVLFVVAGALVLFRVVLREPSPSPQERAAALAAFKSITAVPNGFQGIFIEAESSLANERAILEKSVLSAVEYLQARLNIRIERREVPKTL